MQMVWQLFCSSRFVTKSNFKNPWNIFRTFQRVFFLFGLVNDRGNLAIGKKNCGKIVHFMRYFHNDCYNENWNPNSLVLYKIENLVKYLNSYSHLTSYVNCYNNFYFSYSCSDFATSKPLSRICQLVNFRIPKLVEVYANLSGDPVIKKGKK